MNARVIDISTDDVVVDREGTVWVYDNEVWRYAVCYASDIPELTGWDVHEELPTEFEPYRVLDGAARALVRGALGFGR